MSLTNVEFQLILSDESKRVDGDISWSSDEDHSPAYEFRASVESDAGYPLQLNGRVNLLARTLTFCLLHRQFGSIYRLDLGKNHHNPDCNFIGEVHKHSYEEGYSDKKAYVPPDIAEGIDDVVGVWRQFCREAGISHNGTLQRPPPYQGIFV